MAAIIQLILTLVLHGNFDHYCVKKGATEEQNRYVRYISRLSGNDLTEIATFDAESSSWDPLAPSGVWSSRTGKMEDSFGFCQINKTSHYEMVTDPRFFTDPYWQLRQCHKLYVGGTKFYAKAHATAHKKILYLQIMSKLPSMPFYPGDWLKDPDLRRCSHELKGVWIDMLCLLWECDERGVFITAGVPWKDREVAEAVGGNTDVTLRRIHELLAKRVARRRESDGAIFSERMVRDEKTRGQIRLRVRRFRGNGDVTQNVTQKKQRISYSVSISKKEKYKKKRDMLTPFEQGAYGNLENLCKEFGLENEVDPVLYIKTREEYSQKFPVAPVIRECLYWCKANDKKKITVMRIRNWLANKKKWDKDAELKKQTEHQDKVGKDPMKKPHYHPPVDVDLTEQYA